MLVIPASIIRKDHEKKTINNVFVFTPIRRRCSCEQAQIAFLKHKQGKKSFPDADIDSREGRALMLPTTQRDN